MDCNIKGCITCKKKKYNIINLIPKIPIYWFVIKIEKKYL